MANIKILTLDGLKTVFGMVDTKIATATPTKLSQLVNDANFATKAEVADAVAAVDLSDFYTKAEVDSVAAEKAAEKVAEIVGEAPETYDTLKEIADYIEAHKSVETALNAAIGDKADKADTYTKAQVDSKIADAVTGGVGSIDLSIYETSAHAEATYQVKGEYLVSDDFVAFTTAEIEAAAQGE